MNRKFSFAPDEYYHICNRGVDRRNIFGDDDDIWRFLTSLNEFNTTKPVGSLLELDTRKRLIGGPTANGAAEEKLVDIVAFCINTNHYHLLLRNRTDRGVSEFMKRVNGSHGWYFNNKYKRSGSLFAGKFKASHVATNEYLLHVSAYINLNHDVHKLTLSGPTLASRSSLRQYISDEHTPFVPCETNIILEQFSNRKEYENFALEILPTILERKEEQRELENLYVE